MKVLIDAMRDGIDKELIHHGYEAYSVKRLCEEEKMNLLDQIKTNIRKWLKNKFDILL